MVHAIQILAHSKGYVYYIYTVNKKYNVIALELFTFFYVICKNVIYM